MATRSMRPRPAEPSRHSARESVDRHARKRIKYTEPTSDPEDDDWGSRESHESILTSLPSSSSSAPPPPPPAPRSTRSTAPLPKQRTPSRRVEGRQHPRASAPKSKSKNGKMRNKMRPFGYAKQRTKSSKIEPKATDIHFTGKRMPWQTLPYHILQAVFDYASFPVLAEDFYPTRSVPWLARLARLCKNFAEPALSVLYRAPPLYPPPRLLRLLNTLSTQSKGSWPNYQAKIKKLDFEAVYYFGRHDLTDLLQHTPQLKSITAHILTDNSKFAHPLAHRRKTAYPSGFMEAICRYGHKLEDWTWNHQLHDFNRSVVALRGYHLRESFNSLKSLTLVNYAEYIFPVPDGTRADGSRNITTSSQILLALAELPLLQHLTFQSCDVLEYLDMSELPSGLRTLNILKSDIESQHLIPFLKAKGRCLRSLSLDHNQHLDLSWMTILSNSCPDLQHLHMDLTYHSKLESVRLNDPGFDTLLPASDQPSWPLSLRSIELYHLRKWELDTCRKFLQSLVSAARDLSQLREIRIKASINESGWRERKEFRDSWIDRMNMVFLRTTEPPNPHWSSIKSFYDWKHRQRNRGIARVEIPDIHRHRMKKTADVESDSDAPLAQSSRRNTRTKALPQSSRQSRSTERSRVQRTRRRAGSNSSAEDSSFGDDITSPKSRRQLRIRSAGKDIGHDSDASEPDVTNDGTDGSALFIQGKCDIVDLKIDTQRPMEDQLHESDFLDDEISGDEDWNGEDDFDGDDGYAW